VRVREERAREAAAKPPKRPAPAKRSAPAKRGAPAKPARRSGDDQRLENEIEAAEAALRALEDELSAPAAWSTPKETARSTARHEAAKRTVEELYERLERVAD
jgi:ATP-binding cassette subfamily F protein 3